MKSAHGSESRQVRDRFNRNRPGLGHTARACRREARRSDHSTERRHGEGPHLSRPRYAYGKRVLFIDKDAWVIPHSDIYDRAYELWKIWINDFSFRTKAFEGANVIEYPAEIGFVPAVVVVDMQLEHATKTSLPSRPFPGEHGWYFDQGEKSGTVPEWFTVAAMVNGGH